LAAKQSGKAAARIKNQNVLLAVRMTGHENSSAWESYQNSVEGASRITEMPER